MNIETVNELIRSLESAGELSIREQKFLKLAKAFKQMAAENVALKGLARGWANATDDRLFEEFGEISHDSIDDCEAELKIICPATDRIVAGIKADGASEFISRLQQCVDEGDFVGDEVAVIVGAIDCGKEFCEQLREGAK
ncbi:hypothetical protein ACKLK7_22255 [Klebsiella quasipneumoniae subsp. similipneumoniae]|uniref:hypothetical protein n=1 Tax=Klebsiella quasipneumoniae TaxID=1463165 RepID=UPI000B40ADBD|nr:hypothetical protein [Klebsiella quasipneumoniae]AZJ03907.1 hypothetical protein BME54_08455 [Klebsiella quasipneumoniae]AZJ26910.1 hypothetical protein BME36_008070 [Klebsiella quasipneumoniae subsp. similipneumoniae]MDH2693281.1 hypothetical protein [Klebsiella quasipneumoniae]OVW01566.1 hypothetical protein BME61_18120 [Klebsiella quasipneumoniae subsp. similipneumoniae]OVW15455.1 hypothetical protein BME56_29015 [Klebsiella quasipneumoniae subsp. similipneumoniae]